MHKDASTDLRENRLRADTLASRIGGLSNRRFRGYSSLDDCNNDVAINPKCTTGLLLPTSSLSSADKSGAINPGISTGIQQAGSTGVSNLGICGGGDGTITAEHKGLGLESFTSRTGGSSASNIFSSSRSSSVGSSKPARLASTGVNNKSWGGPGPEGDQDRVQDVQFTPDVTSFLQYCTQAEILLSTFTQG